MRNSDFNNRFRILLTVTLSLLVLSTGAFASGLHKMKSLPVSPVYSVNYEYLISSLNEEVFEETLELEAWMVNLDTFLYEEYDVEQELALENWMTDINSFMVEENEPELTLEYWMTDLASFEVEVENELTLEDWMTDLQAFIPEENEIELALEDWMTDVDSFVSPTVYALKY